MKYVVSQSTLMGGAVRVPSSKSHTMRAILLASMAEGTSTLRGCLPSPDTEAMIVACEAIGARITRAEDVVVIEGVNGAPAAPAQVLDVGNSGQVLRFIAAMAALSPHYTVITGDHSIRTIRPMGPLLEGLTQAGALAVSTKGDGHAPIIIRGPVRAGQMTLEGQDSQPVSALLMMAAFLEGESEIIVRNAGEKPWIGLTLSWLDRLGVSYAHENFERYQVRGPIRYRGFEYTVPGDWSSAAFPIAAALVTGSEVTVENLDFDDVQGDKAILDVLEQMGARFEKDYAARRLTVQRHAGLQGATIDVNDLIDAVPILATVACFATGATRIVGGAIARHKECDRITAIAQELSKMGASIQELSDGLVIEPRPLRGAKVESHHDHRMAMSLAIAGLTTGGVEVNDIACVAKSYPGFAEMLQSVGAQIRTEK